MRRNLFNPSQVSFSHALLAARNLLQLERTEEREVMQNSPATAIFFIYSTLQCRLHVAITLVLFRWLQVSITRFPSCISPLFQTES